MGDQLQGIVRAAKLRPNLNDKECYTVFIRNIEDHLRSMTDTAAEHEAFSCMQQGIGESVMSFHARLMEKVRLCRYSAVDQERFVRAQLMKGMTNRELAKTARTFGHETNVIVQAATRDEAYQGETTRTASMNHHEVINQVRSRVSRFTVKRENRSASNEPQSKQYRREGLRSNIRPELCTRCNKWMHRNRPCPALKLKCNACGKFGHFAVVCRSARINATQTYDLPKGMPEEVKVVTKDEELNALSLEDVLIDCRVGSSNPLKFLIDSGADVNVVGGHDWQYLKNEFESGSVELKPIAINSNIGLRAYAASVPMKIDFAFRATIAATGSSNSVDADFLMVKDGKRSLLGRSTASDLGLLFVGAQIRKCEVVDNGIFPKMPGVKVRFSIDKSVPPTRNAYFNIPAAYREGARRRLMEMESCGIIERVVAAPQWISGMSAVSKGKDDFRLVVNMRAPNKAIKREYFRLPVLDEMKIKLQGARYFTKLDLKSAYYHLELNEESRDLTTFLAENGMFRFTRLMFGVNCAPEIFQREMTRILEGIEHKIIYIDDVLLFADSLEKLRETVAQVLQIFKDNNLTLNTEKCEYDKTEVIFLGHKLDADGFHIEEAKIGAIAKFRRPTTISELRSFLGLASFVSPYIRGFAEISSPLWSVVGSKAWYWNEQQERAFNNLKQQIIRSTVSLGYFSENDETILYTDASPNAIGAVLVQERNGKHPRIISFASKTLTDTEKKYAQNQREALGAVWAVEHFSYFLLGRHFTLRTDASGVTFIFNRSRENSKRALTRADGWALRLSPYDYSIEYVKGVDNIADPSSRLYEGNDGPFDEVSSPWEVAHIEANVVGFITENEIKECTRKDETLQLVIKALETGDWPAQLNRFQAVSEDLLIKDGVLMKLGCAVIPEKLRSKTLEVAHKGHPLTAKLKSILRERVWWPGMATDANEWVKSCETCAVNGRPEKPTPMHRLFAPKTVWETIALDFNGPYARYGGVSILVIIDYRSRYAIARPVKSTSFENTRKILEDVFNKEGYPETIKSDNGPPFNGEEYRNYCNTRGIRMIFSTPFFPQQNGLVENFMKVVNKAMSTAQSEGCDFNEELQAAVNAHNAAAHTVTRMAPEEVMFGRRIRRGLPLLNRGRVSIDEKLLDSRDVEAKLRSKAHEDARRSAKPCKVSPGDEVILERHSKGKGETRFDKTRYTVIQEENGNLLLGNQTGHHVRRHVTQTKKVSRWRSSDNKALPEAEIPKRTSRKRKTPVHLSDYVRQTEYLE
ncbi:uncharacterized protein K02A2.6-like [Armigeres subalbatus]|uniref:uncharacterized protein K02A2.6-like n=1 Tax=Armigeres subalbatus TaxID=124917 RepID=UPI002ED54DFD